jgi:uncharacterized protein with GYD domain
MAKYVILCNFTEQGVRSIGDWKKRAEAARGEFKEAGARLAEVYVTMGSYDAVLIAEGSAEAVAAAVLKMGKRGNVRTNTLTAFGGEEFASIASKA